MNTIYPFLLIVNIILAAIATAAAACSNSGAIITNIYSNVRCSLHFSHLYFSMGGWLWTAATKMDFLEVQDGFS